MSGYGDIDREDALNCVGIGWSGIINFLYDNKPDDIKFVQIKEKFGTLRAYVNWSTPEFDKLIQEAENKSAITCERCGKEGRLRNGSWLLTLCDDCDRIGNENTVL